MQLSYSLSMAVGIAGQLADNSLKDVETYKNPDAAAFFGRVVTQGAAEGEIVHPDAAAEITDEKLVKGIVLRSLTQPCQDDGLDPNHPVESAVPVLRKGRVWVYSESAITVGTSTVNARYDGDGDNGALRGAAVSMETAVLPKSKWKTSTAGADELAQLEIDL